LVRSLVLTDAKIGVFISRSVAAEPVFLYHLIGNKTGEWKVPVGVGALAGELENAARKRRGIQRCRIRSLMETGKPLNLNGGEPQSRATF
jgi:hypothetical protein